MQEKADEEGEDEAEEEPDLDQGGYGYQEP
jgi:hypothetical protein